MKSLPIRVKLTAWYFAVLAATLALFGAVAFFAMQKSIERTVDENLRDRASDVQKLMARVAREDPESLADELREHAELQEEGGLLQVADSEGRWVYRSRLMKGLDVPLKQVSEPTTYNLRIWRPHRKLHLRILATSVSLSGQSYEIEVAAPMGDYREALDHFESLLLMLSPTLLLLASAGGYWMSRRALKPVDEITRTAQNISHKNISSRLTVPQSRDELQRLSETLNGMLERLEGAFKRITQFTGDASHELRTPVALMRTTAELSLRKPRSDAEYREALSQILKELERTSDLIEKLMLLARADSGAEAIHFERIDLAESLREACGQGRTLADAKQLTFEQQIGNSNLFVEGDKHALERLFLILMDNAVKYTQPGGQVTVSLVISKDFAAVEVRDTGIGIASEDLPHIFERFYRAEKARSREFGGIGLGLSIGRWIAEAHGGIIEVESNVGRGSVFRVRLPLSNV